MISIKGKTALVTGASSGIGKETVLALLKEGLIIYAAARRESHMEDLQNKGAIILPMDITEKSSVIEGLNRIRKEKRTVDILINNAGYGSYGAVEDVPIEEGIRQFDVNIFGLARLTQMVLPEMRKNGYGKIVNISSMGGKIYTPFGGWYHATKHALEGFTDCLRLEAAPFGIDAILIEPGGITTPWGTIAAENLINMSGSGAYAERALKTAEGMKSRYESGKMTHPEVIARVILKSLRTEKPKTRYSAGYMAKPSLFLRKILPDRVFDKIIQSMM